MDAVKVKRKFRIYPTSEQAKKLSQTFGCARLIYNKALDWRKQAFDKGEKPNFYKSSSWLTELKKFEEYAFLNEVSCVPMQQSLRHLQTAYQRFFRKQARFPSFKSKSNRQSIELTQRAFSIKPNDKLFVAKVGEIKVKWSQVLKSAPTTATIILEPSGKYYVAFTVLEVPKVLPKVTSKIGIDLGIETFATLSTGEKVKQPKKIRQLRRNLAKAQKAHSRKKRGSKNREKARRKVALVHEKISNVRKDFLDKLSFKLVNENQVVAVEDLNVSSMLKNRNLSRCISEQGWRQFRTMLEYKCDWYGRELRVCDRFFPSSKKCASCGKIHKLDLSTRTVICSCGTNYDRDINASINILAAGQAVSARGENVRPVWQYSLKREPTKFNPARV